MKILTIAYYNYLNIFKSKVSLIFFILLPIFFTIIAGAVFNNVDSNEDETIQLIQVGFVNYDLGDYSKKLLDGLEKSKTIHVNLVDEETMISMVKESKYEAGFIIPEGFSENVEESKLADIQTYKLPNALEVSAIQNIVSSELSKQKMTNSFGGYLKENLLNDETNNIEEERLNFLIKDIKTNFEKNLDNPVTGVNISKFQGDVLSEDYDGKSQTSIGYIIMFVMFNIIFAAGEILEEKKYKTWSRLNISPVSKVEILLGKFTGIFFRGMTQVILLILFGYFVMGVSWGNSIFATFVVLSAFLICVTGLGVFLATLVKTDSQLGPIASVIIVPTTALSGCWWPLFIEPLIMQKIAVVFPQYWAMKGLINTVVGNLGVESVIKTVVILLFMSVIFFIMSIVSDSLQKRMA